MLKITMFCINNIVKKGILNIDCIFWFATLFAYFFQCYDKRLSVFLGPFLIIYIVINILKIKVVNKVWLKLFFLYTSLLFASSVFSFYINGNDVDNIIRFLIILILIPISQNILKKDFTLEWNIVKILSLLKVFSLLYIWINLFISQDYSEYRLWANTMGAGDIYILGGIPRVQLHGNSLLFVTFIVEILKEKRITVYAILSFLGIIACGNASFILGLAVLAFLICRPNYIDAIKKRKASAILFTIGMLIFSGIFSIYSYEILLPKLNHSIPTRIDQLAVLLDTNPLIGNGLGHKIFISTPSRLYNGDIYFELQTLYIYNQTGFLILSLLTIITFLPFLKPSNKIKKYAYISYLIESFLNPYCYDTTHILTLIMIMNLIPKTEGVAK